MRRGFSVLEALVAGALILLLGLAVLSAFPASWWALTQAEQRSQADGLAQSLLDAEQARPFADLTVGRRELPAQGPFRTEVEIFPVAGADATLVKGVRVRVRWAGRTPQEVVHEMLVCGLPRS